MIVGAAVSIATLGFGIWWFSGGGSSANAKPQKTPKPKPTAVEKPLVPAKKVQPPREEVSLETRLDELLRRPGLRARDMDRAVKWTRQLAAAGKSVEASWKRIHELDPTNDAAGAALGYEQLHFRWSKGEWYPPKEAAKIRESARWRTSFGKRCERVKKIFLEELEKLPELELTWHFESDDVPKPYLLMIEKSPGAAKAAHKIGRGLAALRREVAGEYGKHFLPEHDDERVVVPVMVLRDAKSYERYRSRSQHGEFFPTTRLAAAFYVSVAFTGYSEDFDGVLYVWGDDKSGYAGKHFFTKVYHEATHQIMHSATSHFEIHPTPWINEGIAEFWGAFAEKDGDLRFRHFQKERSAVVRWLADRYFDWKRTGKGRERFLSPRQLFRIDRDAFKVAKDAVDTGKAPDGMSLRQAENIVQFVYSLGWGWMFFSHYGLGEKGIKSCTAVLKADLQFEYSLEVVEEAYGLSSEEDWTRITDQFFAFCRGPMGRYARRVLEVPDLRKR